MIEFELKFQVDADQRAAVEAAVARGRSHRTRLRARYFDTADGALAARHIVLRMRKEGSHWVQTIKAPAGGPLQRHEHNFELPTMRGAEPPRPELVRHEGTPVGKLVAKALKKAGHDPSLVEWVPLYDTDVWRTTREMRSGDALVELAFDIGSVRTANASHPIRELEIELKHGSPQSLVELARRWCVRYGLWLDTVAKSTRGERLAQGVVHGPAVKAEPPAVDAGQSGADIFRAVLDTCLRQVLMNASEVAAGGCDAEHVHQLRVGIRRLRTALREMAELAPHIDPAWEAALVEVFQALGRQRDREHLALMLQPQIEAAGGPVFQVADGETPGADPGEVVRSARFQAVLMDLIVASLPPAAEAAAVADAEEAPLVEKPKVDKPVDPRKLLRARLQKLHHQLLRDGKRFEQLNPVEQHRVRKRLKRLRYLGEFVAPLFGRREALRFLEQLEPAQDALGAHNDAATAMSACRESAGQHGAAWFAVGWLVARHPHSAAACHAALAKVARLKPFWKG